MKLCRFTRAVSGLNCDYLKTASDLGVPVIGVGLLYQQGYFRQAVDAHGDQTEFYPYNDPGQLPVMPVRDQNGQWLRIKIDFPGGALWLRAWEAIVGRVKLYLLDSNDPIDSPTDRGLPANSTGEDRTAPATRDCAGNRRLATAQCSWYST